MQRLGHDRMQNNAGVLVWPWATLSMTCATGGVLRSLLQRG
jgi:hypothetical protein